MCLYAGGGWALQGHSEEREVNTRGNDVKAACLTPVSVWREFLKNKQEINIITIIILIDIWVFFFKVIYLMYISIVNYQFEVVEVNTTIVEK